MRHRRMLCCLILAAPLLGIGGAEAAPKRRLGLMIGANDGGRERVRLQYAGTDAKTFALSMQELGGLDPKDCIMLQDIDSAGLSLALDLLAMRVREAKSGNGRVEAIIYYSGHADESGLLLRGKHFGFREFREKVNNVPADVRIAVVDACASGALIKLKGGRYLPAFMSDESSQSSGYAFITSSSANEAAQESDRIRASFFSHFLNTGLRGAADASQDGRVTLHEAYQYAYHETLARTETTAGGPQHAGYDIRIAGSGDVVMTELNRAKASLVLPDSINGRFSIRDSLERLVTEVQKPAGRPLHLALEPGSYRTLWHHSKGIKELRFVLQKGAMVHLISGPEWKSVSKEYAVVRGGVSLSAGPEDNDTWYRNMGKQSQFNLMHNRAREDFRGTQFSLLYNQAESRYDGQQMALVVNSAASSLHGVQGAIGLNYAKGPIRGGQIAYGFNIGRQDLQGVQIASGFNFAQTMSESFQGSGIFNLLGSDGRGAQGSGGFNVAAGSLVGGQGSFVFNYVGGDLIGAQIAGGINFAAGTVEGSQIGILNIARSYRKGAPIGLLNFVGDGVWRGDTWLDETGIVHMGLVTGSRHMNTRLAIGSKAVSDRSLSAATLEVSGHLPLKPVFAELGLMCSVIDGDIRMEADYLQRLRLSAGVDLGRYLSLAGGISWAVLVAPEGRPPWIDGNWLQQSSFEDRVHQWPGAHLSVRLGTYGSGSRN
ncbi:MAG: caspase family protein [Fibrobacterota bacterium]|nr:caspase family protein [Fibrobacterota bacterium]